MSKIHKKTSFVLICSCRDEPFGDFLGADLINRGIIENKSFTPMDNNLFIVIISPYLENDKNAINQIKLIIDNGGSVVPILIHGDQIHDCISDIQYIDFRLNYNNGLESLLNCFNKKSMRNGRRFLEPPLKKGGKSDLLLPDTVRYFEISLSMPLGIKMTVSVLFLFYLEISKLSEQLIQLFLFLIYLSLFAIQVFFVNRLKAREFSQKTLFVFHCVNIILSPILSIAFQIPKFTTLLVITSILVNSRILILLLKSKSLRRWLPGPSVNLDAIISRVVPE